MTRSDARKADLDPLVYVAAQNIFFKHGVQTTLTTQVYGKSYTARIMPRLLHNPTIEITFSPTEETERTQTVRLTQTPCYFGGFRWWLLCPNCNRRVFKLYLIAQYRCRHCHDLTYRSRKRNKRSPTYPVIQELNRQDQLEKLLKHFRTTTYAGQPTKRYLKIMALMNEQSE